MKKKIKIKLREFELQHNSFVTTLQIVWTSPHDTHSRHRQSNKDNVAQLKQLYKDLYAEIVVNPEFVILSLCHCIHNV